MANASAKKSAAARQAAEALYKPLLLLINGAYLALLYWTSRRGSTTATATPTPQDDDAINSRPHPSLPVLAGVTSILWIVQYLCYQSILDDASNSASSSSSKSTPLAGGMALDVLAVALLVQFAGILWSPKAYWALLLIPIGFVRQLYKSFAPLLTATMTSAASATNSSTGSSTAPSRHDAKKRR